MVVDLSDGLKKGNSRYGHADRTISVHQYEGYSYKNPITLGYKPSSSYESLVTNPLVVCLQIINSLL